MKVYISKNRSPAHILPLEFLDRVIFWRQIEYDEPMVERWAGRVKPLCKGLSWLLNLVPRVEYVKIDGSDIMDFPYSMGLIVLPVLEAFRLQPEWWYSHVADEDVPAHLRRTDEYAANEAAGLESEEDSEKALLRWYWILDEMIWAFQQLRMDYHDDRFYDNREVHAAWRSRKSNGHRLFGKYFEALQP